MEITHATGIITTSAQRELKDGPIELAVVGRRVEVGIVDDKIEDYFVVNIPTQYFCPWVLKSTHAFRFWRRSHYGANPLTLRAETLATCLFQPGSFGLDLLMTS
jgi:hypothetical protein